MKNLLRSGVLVLITVMLVYILFLQQCRGKNYWIPKGKIIVNKSAWDSLKNIKPTIDTIIHDTIDIGDIVYVPHDSLIYVVDSMGMKHYSDSIVNDSIHIWNDLFVQGIIKKWDQRYEPVIRTITETVTITVPQFVEVPVYNSDNGLYPSIIVGGNSGSFLFGGGIDLITKKDYLYGLQYQRFGNKNIYSFKLGFKIKGKRNK
jgi:hypothetical protein